MEAASKSSRSLTMVLIVSGKKYNHDEKALPRINNNPSYKKDLSQSIPFSATAG